MADWFAVMVNLAPASAQSGDERNHSIEYITSKPHPDPKQPAAVSPLPPLEEMFGDIERLICHVVSPYVDDSNPMLHLDELCAECRYKLAKIISAGRIQQCPTRAKFFGYLKVSFLNHVRTLVEKYAFSQKRSGFRPQCRSLENATDDDQYRRKPFHLSLDDEELGLQVGHIDESLPLSELIEALEFVLSPEERELVHHLKEFDLPQSQGRSLFERETSDAHCRPSWKLKRYAAELGLTGEDFARLMKRIRSKCRAVVVLG